MTNCEFTSDRGLLAQADLVLISLVDIGTEQNLPQTRVRPAHQQWAYVMVESPWARHHYLNFNGYFNFSSTFQLDSDFPQNLDMLIWEDPKKKKKISVNNEDDEENEDKINRLVGKTGFASALISNCGAISGRDSYINEMRKYVEVDVYGRCGRQCPSAFKNGTQSGDCRQIISEDYKFFLSFENSMCKGYVSEKFFFELKYNVIPVVMGAGIYDHYVSLIL